LEKRSKFKNFDLSKLKMQKPPKDSSLETFREIQNLTNIKDDEKFVKDNDDIMKVFENFAKANNFNFPKENVEKMSLDAYDDVIKKLKLHFNRPRPKELAKQYGINLNDIELKSMKTPSYPSGHSAQGRLVANYLNDLNNTSRFTVLGNNISDSRNVAKAHYESDSKFGKKIGDMLYDHIKQDGEKS
tara:strand:+ start:1136 stop:1696 length:561 start_codon:yes stop_codon:yes gene_type:complete